MKTKIVIGSLFAAGMLLMLPIVSAIEFNTVVEANKSRFLEQINVDGFRQNLKYGRYPWILAILIDRVVKLKEKYKSSLLIYELFDILHRILGGILYIGLRLGIFTE